MPTASKNTIDCVSSGMDWCGHTGDGVSVQANPPVICHYIWPLTLFFLRDTHALVVAPDVTALQDI